jgi:hypothetical protein
LRFAGLAASIVLGLMVSPKFAFAKEKPGAEKEKPGAEKMEKEDEKRDEKKDAKKKDEKSGAMKDTAAAAKGRMYRFKGEKKMGGAAGQQMSLLVEDPFTGKSETLAVPNNDPTKKEYDPLTAVADVVKKLKPGDIIDVETEKQKGRAVVTAVSKAKVEPGEELPNGYVFVEQDEVEKNGMPSITVTLRKFGREVKVGVPFKKDDEYKDAKWEPDPKIDYVVRRLQSGAVVEALVRKGNPPMLAEIYEYRPPEKGTFVGVKDVEYNNWPAAGFEIKAADGTTITFTLDGTEVTKNGKTIYQPNPQQFAAVKRIKPDSEVEVRYRLEGRMWMLRDIKVVSPPATAKKSGKTAPKDEAKTAEKTKDDAKKS